MSFTLEVEFSGLCFHLVHPDKTQIGVVLPDGRLRSKNDIRVHADGLVAKSHVGYLRFDLADTGLISAGEFRDHPSYEVVHLFDHEELDFGLTDDVPLDPPELAYPDLSGFAPTVSPAPGLFSTTPPKELLMRTVLRGGAATSTPDSDTWIFSDLFNPGQPPYTGRFAGSSLWTRPVSTDELALRIKSFDGAEKAVVRLKPRQPGGTVKLKIANLCTENPLEWEELGFRKLLPGQADDDFKWFYRLLRHPDGTFEQLTRDRGQTLPRPAVDGRVPGNEGGGPNCEGLKATAPF